MLYYFIHSCKTHNTVVTSKRHCTKDQEGNTGGYVYDINTKAALGMMIIVITNLILFFFISFL